MKIKSFLIALFCGLAFTACDKDDYVPASDLLPLKVGNYWTFGNSGKFEVTGTTKINAHTYYVVMNNTYPEYYRIDGNNVYKLDYENREQLFFKTNADEGDTWKFGEYVAKLYGKNETVTINGKEVTGCYDISFDIPEYIDDEFSVVLAPGIGFLKLSCGECVFPSRVLTEAGIDGKVLKF